MYSSDFFVMVIFGLSYILVLINELINKKSCNLIDEKKYDWAKSLYRLQGTIMTLFTFKLVIEQTYLNGSLGILLFLFCDPISYFLVSGLLINRLVKAKRNSIYEWISYFYGDTVRSIFAIGEFISNTAFISIQIKILAEILSVFEINDNFIKLILLLFTIAIIVNSLSDKKTKDNIIFVIAKLTFMVFIPCLIMFIIVKYDNDLTFIRLFDSNNNPRMNLSNYFSSIPGLFISLAIIMRFIFPFVDSTIYDTVVAKGQRKTTKEFIFSSSLLLIYCFFYIIAAMFMFNVDPTLSENEIIPFFIRLSEFPFMHGFLVVTLFYIGLKISITTLRSMSNIIVNDFLKTFMSPVYYNENKIKIVSTIAIGVISLFFGLMNISVYDLFFYSSCGNFPILIVPLTLTILGLRTHKNCIYASAASGFISSMSFIIFTLHTEYCKFAFFPGMIVNLIVLLISHLYYVYVKGFKFEKIEIDELTSDQDSKLYNEKVIKIIDIARSNLIIRIKTMFANNNDFPKMSDAEIIKSFIKNDLIKDQIEYKLYRIYICKFRLNKNCNINNNLDNDNVDFFEAVNKDVEEFENRKK